MELIPDLYDLAQEIDRNLREVRKIQVKSLEAQAARLGLTVPQRNVIRTLFRSNGLSLKELSQQVGLAHSTVSGIVDRLEKKGLALRQPDQNDARLTKITVSAPVREQWQEMRSALAIHPLAEALKRATADERKAICQAVSTLRRLMGG